MTATAIHIYGFAVCSDLNPTQNGNIYCKMY